MFQRLFLAIALICVGGCTSSTAKYASCHLFSWGRYLGSTVAFERFDGTEALGEVVRVACEPDVMFTVREPSSVYAPIVEHPREHVVSLEKVTLPDASELNSTYRAWSGWLGANLRNGGTVTAVTLEPDSAVVVRQKGDGAEASYVTVPVEEFLAQMETAK